MLSLSESSKTAEIPGEQQIEEERMRDVEVLLESLFLREEVTLRLIIDCLYDVGAVNLVNRRVRSRPLNRLMKMIARWSKPICRPLVLRWSKKNCPRMITTWLHSQVRFPPAEVVVPEVLAPDNPPVIK